MEKDTRPVKCRVCKRKMYYAGHPKHEPEVNVDVEYNGSAYSYPYVHVKCISGLGRIIQQSKDFKLISDARPP